MSAALTLRAIETHYKGYRLRSRLEARWAVFFDAMGLEWEYEPQGFACGDTAYLPDFYLPGLAAFVEIKGQMPTGEEYAKAQMLSTLRRTYIFKGDPMGAFVWCFAAGEESFGPTTGTLEWGKPSKHDMVTYWDDYNDWERPNLILRREAETCGKKARQARFEHGERP